MVIRGVAYLGSAGIVFVLHGGVRGERVDAPGGGFLDVVVHGIGRKLGEKNLGQDACNLVGGGTVL